MPDPDPGAELPKNIFTSLARERAAAHQEQKSLLSEIEQIVRLGDDLARENNDRILASLSQLADRQNQLAANLAGLETRLNNLRTR